MRDTITCLKQSGIPVDQEKEFFTKYIYIQIGLKCFAIKVQCINSSICQTVMLKHMAFSILNHVCFALITYKIVHKILLSYGELRRLG